MAVPKKRTGHSAQGHRRSNWKATVPETTNCKNCGELTLTHTVCTECGYYKGKPASIKQEGSEVQAETKTEEKVEAKIEEKPKAKAKPKAKKEEAVVEAKEEVQEKTEESKEEASE